MNYQEKQSILMSFLIIFCKLNIMNSDKFQFFNNVSYIKFSNNWITTSTQRATNSGVTELGTVVFPNLNEVPEQAQIIINTAGIQKH